MKTNWAEKPETLIQKRTCERHSFRSHVLESFFHSLNFLQNFTLQLGMFGEMIKCSLQQSLRRLVAGNENDENLADNLRFRQSFLSSLCVLAVDQQFLEDFEKCAVLLVGRGGTQNVSTIICEPADCFRTLKRDRSNF